MQVALIRSLASACPITERVPFIRGVPKLPALRNFGCNSALPQIFPGGFPDFLLDQILVEPFRSFGM